MVIDDAYDPPEFDPEFGGDLLDILSAGGLRSLVSEELLDEAVREAAIEALDSSDLDNSAIPTAVAGLYQVFVDRRTASVDPGGVFAATKGSALEALEPLVELLQRCQDVSRVVKVGRDDALERSKDVKPDVIFMDFILSPSGQTTTDITDELWTRGGAQSVELLRAILAALSDSTPAVVLMSSQDVAGDTDAYFSRLDDGVMGLRFGFLEKGWVQGRAEGLTASGAAADVLMDTSGIFDFGRTLERALAAWKVGAEEALRQLCVELREFDVKDFAYLLRFRLHEEGEPFADYLEWFVGESLRAIIDDKVDWTVEEFARLNDSSLTCAIEGAHPLLSDRLAKFFHRMRFSARTSRPRGRLFLGDLFMSSDGESIRMVVSPDCDLVPRNGSHAASRILTVGGSVRRLHEGPAVAGDLIYHNDVKVIKWNLKDLMTHECEDLSSLEVGDASYTFTLSMRPMWAQAIQKAVLADLARVGLAVPPTVGIGAPVKVYLRKKVGNRADPEEIEGLKDAHGQVILPRGGKDLQMRVLFTRRFLRELLGRLEELDDDDLLCDHRGHWRDWVERTDKVREAMLRDGVKLPGKGVFNLKTSIGEPVGKSWLEIVVDISAEARIDMQGIDPLVL